MARQIRSIEIYLPLEFNDGRTIPESKYVTLQRELLKRYGGVTSIQRRFPLEGVWQSGTEVFQDKVIVFSAMNFHDETQAECLDYLSKLKKRLKTSFDQLEILITVAEMMAV